VLHTLIAMAITGALLAPPSPADAPSQASMEKLSAADESILALEKSLWDAEKVGDAALVAKRLAPEFLQIEASGMIDRAGALTQIASMRLESYALSNVRVLRPAASDVAIVTFEFVQKEPGKPASRGFAASTWANRGGVWLNVLYVGVPRP
jgi:hypothetical protein